MQHSPSQPAALVELGVEITKLATFANRAPTEGGRDYFFSRSRALQQWANRLGYPSLADAIENATKYPTWSGRANALRAAAGEWVT